MMLRFLMVISWYFTVMVSYCQYWVSSPIISESICLKLDNAKTKMLTATSLMQMGLKVHLQVVKCRIKLGVKKQ
jgi:hypothetical protein